MKEFEFKELKNIDIPDDWVKKALNVPEKTPLKVIFLKRVLPIAATFVLVFTLSFFVLHLTKDNTIKTAPLSPSEKTVGTDDNNLTETDPYADVTSQGDKDDIEENSTEVEDKTQAIQPTVEQETQSTEKPSQKPTESPEEKPTSPTEPDIPGKPQGGPTNPDHNKPQGGPSNPDQNDPSLKPEDSPEISPEPSTPQPDTPMVPQSTITCKASFDESLLKGSDEVYITITEIIQGDMSGEDKFQTQTKYQVTDIQRVGNMVHVKFNLVWDVHYTRPGLYAFCFYNKQGDTLYVDMKDIEA